MRKSKRWGVSAIFLFSMVIVLTGCSTNNTKDIAREEEENIGEELFQAGEESSDYYVVESKNEKKQTITLRSISTGHEELFVYSGTTNIENKYKDQLTMKQVEVGEVVIIEYQRDKDKNYKLTYMKLPKAIWTYDQVSELSYNEQKQMITVGKQKYQYGNSLLVTSNDELIRLTDLNDLDVVRIRGNGTYIYSITVTQGHGYIRLKNEEDYIGGWIEVGEKVIQQIERNMLLAVPEGLQQVKVSKKGYSASGSVTLERGKEAVVDVKNLTQAIVESGSIRFKINPQDAILSINGKKADYSKAVVLEYGIYQITVKAEGYENLSKKLVVQSSSAVIELELTQSDTTESSADSNSDSSNSNSASSINLSSNTNTSSSGNTNTNSTSTDSTTSNTNSETTEEGSNDTTYKIYIHGPEEAEVYFDGEYKGIIPVVFEKSTGTHTISIRKSGYITKSYTVPITEDNEDVDFVFPSLTKANN